MHVRAVGGEAGLPNEDRVARGDGRRVTVATREGDVMIGHDQRAEWLRGVQWSRRVCRQRYHPRRCVDTDRRPHLARRCECRIDRTCERGAFGVRELLAAGVEKRGHEDSHRGIIPYVRPRP
jgi:hypothetical protein